MHTSHHYLLLMFQKIKEACLQGDKEKVSESLLNDKDHSLVTEYGKLVDFVWSFFSSKDTFDAES